LATRTFLVARHTLLDFGSRATKARGHRADGYAERLGDLGRAELLELEQDQDRAQILRELAQHAIEQIARAALIEQVVGGRQRCRLFALLEPGRLTAAASRPMGVRRDARGGSVEEGTLRALRDGIEPSGGNQEYSLRGIVGVGGREPGAPEHAPDESVVAPRERVGTRRLLASRGRADA